MQPSMPVLKGLERRNQVALPFIVPTTPSTSTPSARSPRTLMPSTWGLAGEGSEQEHMNSQFRHLKIALSTSTLLSHITHTYTGRVTEN